MNKKTKIVIAVLAIFVVGMTLSVAFAEPVNAKKYKNKDIDKRAMLTEIDGMDAVKGSKAAFDKLITKADAYLAYKMDEKGVSSIDRSVKIFLKSVKMTNTAAHIIAETIQLKIIGSA